MRPTLPPILPYEIALCSWSTHLADAPSLHAALNRLHLRTLHLALGPLASLPESARPAALNQFLDNPLLLSAGMIAFPQEDYRTLHTIRATGGLVPDSTFPDRRQFTLTCARLARQLGLTLVSTHVGFIPPASDRPAFTLLQSRLRQLADDFAHLGLHLLFETGQESADTLAAFLSALDHPHVGVNFDPANLLLYGKGDPVAAIHTLAPWIKHVHAKDTLLLKPPPANPAAWRGTEIPLGHGDAQLPQVIAALQEINYSGPLAIEREAGEHRTADILAGIAFLQSHGGILPPNNPPIL